MILAIVNNKGGVGKTTTAVNLAAGLATPRRRVLLVDLDSQGSASLALGIARADLAPSAAEVLLDGLQVRAAIRPTPVAGLDLLTGSMALANADIVLGEVAGREHRLREALAPVRDAYRFILLDCPPSLSLLPINALVASDAFLVPVTPQYLAVEGLVNLMDAVARLQASMDTHAPLLGLVLTLVDCQLPIADRVERAHDARPRQQLSAGQPGPALLVDPLHDGLPVAPRDRIADVQDQWLAGEGATVRLPDLFECGVRHHHHHHVAKGDGLFHSAGLGERTETRRHRLEMLGMARREHHRRARLDEKSAKRATHASGPN